MHPILFLMHTHCFAMLNFFCSPRAGTTGKHTQSLSVIAKSRVEIDTKRTMRFWDYSQLDLCKILFKQMAFSYRTVLLRGCPCRYYELLFTIIFLYCVSTIHCSFPFPSKHKNNGTG